MAHQDKVISKDELQALYEKYALQKVYAVTDPRDLMILDVAQFVHEDRWLDAGEIYAKWVRSNKDPHFGSFKDKTAVITVVTQLVHWCLNNNRYWLAGRLLWTESQFDARPAFTRRIFDAWTNHAVNLFMGAASCSKSYGSGVWLMLDWIRDPEYTSIRVLGPSEKHLNENLFSHLVQLHQSASIPLPGEVGDLYIGTDRRNRFGSISGVVVPLGKKSAGRLQGTKAGNKKRKQPHPIFGKGGRLRIFLDEFEKIPDGITKDLENIMANLEGIETFKIGAAFNPEDPNGKSGVRAAPRGGWKNFDLDRDFNWRSERGWNVVRLDAYQCENIIEGVTLFDGLQTREKADAITTSSGGPNSPGHYTMVRAAFPPTTTSLNVLGQHEMDAIIGTFVFIGRTRPVTAADMALEGGDAAPFALGEFGRAIGYKTAPTVKEPRGTFVEFKNAAGDQISRPALQVTQMFKLETGDTLFMASQIKNLNMKLGVTGSGFMMDRTGVGQGVFDMLRSMWSEEVGGVNYQESASETKILEEDTQTCKEEYDRACSELWFAFKKWGLAHLIKISPAVDMSAATGQLTSRQYAPGKTNRVEAKRDYKLRTSGKSPDEADTLTLIVHGARKLLDEVPSVRVTTGKGDAFGEDTGGEDDWAWSYTDPTNRAERGMD